MEKNKKTKKVKKYEEKVKLKIMPYRPLKDQHFELSKDVQEACAMGDVVRSL